MQQECNNDGSNSATWGGTSQQYWYDADGNQHAFDDEEEYDEADAELDSTYNAAQPESSTSKAQRSANSKKRKITRIRPLRSCLSCNRRKIKCDRDTPCGPCSKRGEGDACSLVAGLSAVHLTNAAIAERLAQLEARVEDLENTSSPAPSPARPLVEHATTSSASKDSLKGNLLKSQLNCAAGHPDNQNHPSSLSGPPVPLQSGSNGKLSRSTSAAPAVNVESIQAKEGGYPYNQAKTGKPSDSSKLSQEKDEFIAANCETEEAALALESLCRTEDVLERSEVAGMGMSSSKGSISLPVAPKHPSSTLHSRTTSMSMGNILNPPFKESTGLRTITMSPMERKHRSTILIDPINGGISGHRLQRSLDSRIRIFTSPNFPNPLWHVHIGWLFDDEYKEFWKLRIEGRHIEIDPAWGALFFMTLALGLQVTELPLPQHLLPHPTATQSDILALADSYIPDVEEMLTAADWARKPQLRVLQTLALFSAFQSLHNLRDPTTFTMNGAGIRIAQILGLHDLGDYKNPKALSAMLSDDLAVPTHNQPLKDHLARMLWHTLVVLELVHVTRAGIDVPLASTPYSTQLPSNIDDIDFQNLPISATAGSVTPKPTWQLTSVSSLHLRSLLSSNDKRLLDLPASMKATEKYTHVMSIDAELRKWISASPTRQAVQHDYAAYRLSQWQHWSLMADVHGAIVHAHRPYMTRGYSDPRFSFSTKTCLESAKVLCESWQHLRDYMTDQRFWWTTMRYLSAALVIFIDLFIAMDDGCPEEVLAKKRSDIPLICEILQERMSSVHSTTSQFAAAAFGVVSNLLEAEKAKKSAMIARRHSTDGTIGEEVEPVGRVFKRIAETMTSGSSVKSEGSMNGLVTIGATQSSSQDLGLPSANSADNLTEQPTFVQPSHAARRIEKQSRRPSEQGLDPTRSNKTPRWSPAQVHLNTATADPTLEGTMNRSNASSPGLHLSSLPSAASSSTPSFAMDTSTSISRHDSYNSVGSSAYPWINPENRGGLEPQTQANYNYMNDGSFSTTPHPQQTFSQGYEQQLQPAPISWDTSTLFHPDPSVLLHSMGFPASQHQLAMGLPQTDHQRRSPAMSNQPGQYTSTGQGVPLPTSWYTGSTGQF